MPATGGAKPRKVTIRDVARASGTSISTVSVALSGGPGVSDETRSRVIEMANRLGWRPDRRASILRRQDPRLIGVVYEVSQPFQANLIDAVYVAAAEHDINISLAGATPHHSERRSVTEFLRDRAQAIVLMGSELTDEDFGTVATRVPVLSLCRYVDIGGVDVVVSDDELGFRQSVGHLVELGHRDIVHVDGGNASRLAGRRVDAYRKAMAEFGLGDHVRVICGGHTVIEGVEAARRVLDMDPLPTAVVCYNDMVAVGLSRRLEQMGVNVPGEISVVGFDDGPTAEDPTVSLTTVAQETGDLAMAAMELIARRISEDVVVEPGRQERVTIPTRLTVRRSTAPARHL